MDQVEPIERIVEPSERKRAFWGVVSAVIAIIVLTGVYIAVQQGIFEDHGEIVEASFEE